jgi:filamentous hemagglutinin
LASIGESAIADAAIGLSAGVLGPAALAVAGDALTGVGLVTGSTSIFGAGISATEASVGLSAAIFGGSTGAAVLNDRGEPYPDVEVENYGKVPFPKDAQYTPLESRVPRSTTYRSDYIDNWNASGKPTPTGGWGDYRIHYVQPLEYGGTNDIKNLVHLTQQQHDLFTDWWAGGYGPR